MDQKKYVTEAELAERFNVSEEDVRAWRYRKRAPAYTKLPNGKILYNLTKVEEWLKENTVKTSNP